jgi:large subunit ribosomal protein L28
MVEFGVCAGPVAVTMEARRHFQVDISMAQTCALCGKKPAFGRIVSHAHNVSLRRFNPNLQSVRAVVDGATKRIRVCTRCIKSNKVVKAA